MAELIAGQNFHHKCRLLRLQVGHWFSLSLGSRLSDGFGSCAARFTVATSNVRVSWQLFRVSVESRAAKNLRPRSVGECTLEVEFNLGISSGPLIGAVGGRGV